MLDLKKVKEIIELMKENDLVEVELVDGEQKVHLKRPHATLAAVPAMSMPVPMAPAANLTAPAASSPAEPVKTDASPLLEIKSPIIGTFYQAPAPDAEPYVKVGSRVNPDTVVCIVEAMKVMNEIKAEVSGTIVEVCCKDGQSVEFGQVLFRVKP